MTSIQLRIANIIDFWFLRELRDKWCGEKGVIECCRRWYHINHEGNMIRIIIIIIIRWRIYWKPQDYLFPLSFFFLSSFSFSFTFSFTFSFWITPSSFVNPSWVGTIRSWSLLILVCLWCYFVPLFSLIFHFAMQ